MALPLFSAKGTHYTLHANVLKRCVVGVLAPLKVALNAA